MSDIFVGVDPVVSKRYFRHLFDAKLDRHRQHHIKPSAHKTSHHKSHKLTHHKLNKTSHQKLHHHVVHKTSHKSSDITLLKKQLAHMESELSLILQEFTQLQKSTQPIVHSQHKTTEKKALLDQLHELEHKLLNFEKNQHATPQHIQMLKKRIHIIREALYKD